MYFSDCEGMLGDSSRHMCVKFPMFAISCPPGGGGLSEKDTDIDRQVFWKSSKGWVFSMPPTWNECT